MEIGGCFYVSAWLKVEGGAFTLLFFFGLFTACSDDQGGTSCHATTFDSVEKTYIDAVLLKNESFVSWFIGQWPFLLSFG